MNLFSGLDSLESSSIKVYNLADADVILHENFFSAKEAENYMSSFKTNILWKQERIKLFNKEYLSPRLTAWYADSGLKYSYSGLKLEPNLWTEDLWIMKQKIEQKLNVKFNSVLLNWYRNGNDSMGWHQDNEHELGKNPVIASVSLGQERKFQLKHVKRNDLPLENILLKNGSLLLMQGSTQHFWKHQLPKTKQQVAERINLTFRTIK